MRGREGVELLKSRGVNGFHLIIDFIFSPKIQEGLASHNVNLLVGIKCI